jgi:hypothetical protein
LFLLVLAVWGGQTVWGNAGAGEAITPAVASPPSLLVQQPPATLTPTPPPTASLDPETPPVELETPPVELETPTAAPMVETVVVVVTATLSPTRPVADPTPRPTILFPDGRRLEMWYNEDSFYLHNPGDLRVQLAFLVFEAIDEAGRPLEYQFEGWRWARYYQFLEPGGCVRLEQMQGVRYIRPPVCEIYNSSVTPTEDDPEIFWLPREGVAQFRAIWRQEEVGRCPVSSGFCEIYLP